LDSILSVARWAPSGDNAQPWRFERTGEDSVTVHLLSEAGTNPYEYRGGQPSLLVRVPVDREHGFRLIVNAQSS
jgi:sulfur-carrier protein adenylyltransferase/sulfurtransferase